LIRLLKIGGSIAALALGLHLLDWDKLVAGASRIDLYSFLIALALALLSIGTTGLRWIYIVHWLAPAPEKVHWRVYCVGTFFNSFTPANVGGDVYRVFALRQYAGDGEITGLVAAVTLERILGLASFLCGYLIALGAWTVIDREAIGNLPKLLIYPAAPAAAFLAIMALLPLMRGLPGHLPILSRHPGLMQQVSKFQFGIRLAVTRNLGMLGILSVLAWGLWVATVAVVAARLGVAMPLALLATIVSLTEIIRLIPISFQGIGIREGVFSALVGLAGWPAANGFAAAAVAYAAMSLALVISGLAGGLLTLTTSQGIASGSGKTPVKAPHCG
jgi:glycosyltransferase 2 family protein